MAECPCRTCEREKRCEDRCMKQKQWFAEEWKRLRQIFLGVGGKDGS